MIEFSVEDEDKVIQHLITDMNPKSMADAIPGLPAHILFMCIRHADHVNDDRRMQSLLTNSINSIRKVVKVSRLNVSAEDMHVNKQGIHLRQFYSYFEVYMIKCMCLHDGSPFAVRCLISEHMMILLTILGLITSRCSG